MLTIPQGDEESERVGRKITVKSINGLLNITGNPAVGNDFLRLSLVQDTQANGGAATYSGVGGVYETDVVPAMRNLDNSARFKVLKNWLIPVTATSGIVGAFGTISKHLKINLKCNIPISYDSSATTGAIGTIRANNLFLLARAQVSDDASSCAGVIRIRYSDN